MHVLINANDRDTHILNPDSPYNKSLRVRFPQCEFRCLVRGTETMEDITWADVITGHPTREQLAHAKNLKWLHVQSAGVNGYEKREYFASDKILVTRTADTFSVAIAEHVIGLILALNRNFSDYILQGDKHNWQRHEARYELCSSTVLMVGMGNLASEIVKRLRGFSCAVTGIRRDTKKSAPGYDYVYGTHDLHVALSHADYIINTLPLTRDTEKMFGAAEFASMKSRAMFVNVGRGATVDQNALIAALDENRIAGAGLDVTEPEPLPPDSALWGRGNVIITSHSSGFSEATHDRRCACFADNLEKFLKGETLDHLVDFSVGY